MNSGCYDNDISKVLISLKAIDKNNLSEINKKENIKFSYRGTNLPNNLIIWPLNFKAKLKKAWNRKKQSDFIEKKKFPQVKLKPVAVLSKI